MWEPVPSEVMRWRELLPGEPQWPRNVAPHGMLASPRPALTTQCQWEWTYIGRAVGAPMLAHVSCNLSC
eukprot:10458149-Prorocentrum_lima.AAC.1